MLVLGRSDGHHVGVESEEFHTVGQPQEGEEKPDDAHNEVMPETKESYHDSPVDHEEDEQEVDVEGDNVGLDLDDGAEDHDGEDKAQEIKHKSTDGPAKWEGVVVPEDEENQVAGEPHQVSDELEDQQGQTAHFDGFEDPSSPVVPDSVEEEDVEGEKQTSVQESQDPIPQSQGIFWDPVVVLGSGSEASDEKVASSPEQEDDARNDAHNAQILGGFLQGLALAADIPQEPGELENLHLLKVLRVSGVDAVHHLHHDERSDWS